MARRITPIAVEQPVAPTHVLGAELPLDVGPAPDQGDVKQQHATLGAGRRIWVDIQHSWQLKFKQVLRQQALDYSTWKHDQDEKYAAHYKAMYGEGLDPKKLKPDLLTGMLKRVQGMLQPDSSDEVGTSDGEEDDSDEEGDGDEEEGGEDASSDDAEDGGAGDANEIDLDKEAEADAGRKKAKRQRFERYEDDFIDDSEIEKVKGGPKVKTQHTGFYVNVGNLAVIEEPTKQRRRAPKQPTDPAAAAAGCSGAAKRRKEQYPHHKQLGQPEQQQQPKQMQKERSQQPQQQQEDALKKRKKAKQGEAAAAAAAAAGDGSEPSEAAGKKKRARSEAGGAPGAGAEGAAVAPASKKARKASPATSEAAAAAPPPPVPQAAAGANAAGVAQAAVAAARAAAAARKPAVVGGVRGASPAAALPPAGPSAAKQGSAPQEQLQAPPSRRIAPIAVDAAGVQRGASAAAASAAAVSAAFPGGSQPDAPEAGTGTAGAGAGVGAAEPAGAGGAAPVGLPDEIVTAALELQRAVQENDASVSGPGATTATRNKVLGAPLSALGLAFARLSEAQQQQHEAQLLALVGPQLGHLGDKALRKKLLQEPRDKLGAAQEGREKLLEALAGIKGTAAGGAGAGEGTASDDDFQQAWSTVAEDSLVTAWNTAKAVGGQQGVNELALEVAAALGNTAVQGQPDKAASELQQVFNRAKRRQKAAKEESKAIAAASAAAAAVVAGADEVLEAAAAARTPSRQLCPAPSTAAAVAAAPGAVAPVAGTPAAKGQGQQGRESQDSDTATDEGGAEAEADAAAGKDTAGAADAGTQAAKVEFSQWSAPSPRLERCIAAAKEAGAPEEWLQEKYASIRKGSTYGHQAFRILCFAGPAGCALSEFKAVADRHSLGMQLDDSSKGRHLLKQALSGKGLSSFVGISEADAHKRALLAFPGVVPKPAKAARASTPALGGQAEGQGGSGGGAAAD